MKNLFSLIFLAVFSLLQLSADVKAVLAPYNGAYGVNVGSERYNSYINTSLKDGGWVSGTPSKGDGTYNNDCIVVMGEVSNFALSENEDFFIRITVNTDSDFNYVSLSDSTYRRPYTLTVIGKCTPNDGDQYFIKSQPLEANGSNVVTFNYREGKLGSSSVVPGSAAQNSMWFDMVLGLPVQEITSSGLLTLPSGEQIVLGRVDDYASFVTVTMEYGKVNGTTQVTTLTIPFSGYYRADNTDKDKEATASLHVDTTVRVAALDIKKDAKMEVDIGRLRFALTKILENNDATDTNKINETKRTLESIRLFISASPDPFVQEPDGFRLVHADYGIEEPINDYNSVPFNIITRTVNSSESVSFDGRGFVNENNIIGESIKPTMHDSDVEFSHSDRKSYYVNYEGELSIYIDYGGYAMKPGLYQEDVYVHVISGV